MIIKKCIVFRKTLEYDNPAVFPMKIADTEEGETGRAVSSGKCCNNLWKHLQHPNPTLVERMSYCMPIPKM